MSDTERLADWVENHLIGSDDFDEQETEWLKQILAILRAPASDGTEPVAWMVEEEVHPDCSTPFWRLFSVVANEGAAQGIIRASQKPLRIVPLYARPGSDGTEGRAVEGEVSEVIGFTVSPFYKVTIRVPGTIPETMLVPTGTPATLIIHDSARPSASGDGE